MNANGGGMEYDRVLPAGVFKQQKYVRTIRQCSKRPII